MKFLPLLGQRLKNEDIMEVLENSDIEVVYDFDRLHENIADKYWATSENDGFQLRFDENQILDTIFIYIAAIDGFSPIDPSECDVDFFRSISEVEAWAATQKIKTTRGGPHMLLEVEREWIRLEFEKHRVHYEFRSGALGTITISHTK